MLFCRSVGIDHHQIHHWLDNRREPPTSLWKKLARILEMGDSIDGIFAMCEEARVAREVERVAVEAWLLEHPNWAKRSTWRRKYLKAWKLGKPLPKGWSYPPQKRRREANGLLRSNEVPPVTGEERGGDPVSVPEAPRREEGQAPNPHAE